MNENNAMIFGLDINKLNIDQVTQLSIETILKKRQLVFACANAHSLMVTRQDKEFAGALKNADLLVADGSGISLAGKILNADLGPRITGYDYFHSLSVALNKGIDNRKARIFFMGSSQNTLDAIKEKMPVHFPDIELCGTYSPPFGNWPEGENEKIIDIINAAQPDVVWVGMTAPKQEKWSEKNRDKINAPIIGSIGAVFDFFAGTLDRAPEWMRNLGLEWLYRFIMEPKRTWKRHLISEPGFVIQVLLQKFR